MTEQSTEPLTVGEAFEKNVSTFEGHPAEEIGDDPDKGDSKDDKKPEESEDDKKAQGQEADKSPDKGKFEFKYASQEAAEKGVKDAKTLMHEKAADAKRERERAEALQVELNLVKTPVAPEESKLPEPNSADKMKELLDQVNKLDPEDDDYHLKVAEIWGQREDAIQSGVDAKVEEALAAYDKKVQEDKARTDAEFNTQKSILSNAATAGTEAGFDMKKGSSDSELFWAFADKAPEGSIEEQIQWTVDKVKGIKTTLAAPGKEKEEKEAEAARKAKENQEQNNVLERQGEGRQPDKQGPVAPLPLADGFKQIQRRI